MKTLDEVIDAMERCSKPHYFERAGCPYEDDDAETGCHPDDRDADALYYLKEYRSEKAMWEADRKGYLDWIEQYKESREKHQQAVIELKKNPALTWDELKTMEGKPVWVEAGKFGSHWYLIEEICQNETIVCLGKFHESITLYHEDILTYWQAYRKERK